MKTLNGLAWRSLAESRARSILSVLAVALGVAMTVAASVISRSIINSLETSEDARILMSGLMDQFDTMLTITGVLISCAAGFLVFNAFAMSITQRRQQIGALRALGMTRRQVMRLVLFEALIIGGAGTLTGLVAGPLLGQAVIALMKIIIGNLFVFTASSPALFNMVLAVALGLGVTLLAALIPAWQAARVSPLVALRQRMESDTSRSPARPAWAAMLISLAFFAYLASNPPGASVVPPWDVILSVLFIALWLVCIVVMLPALIGGLGRRLRGPLAQRWHAIGRLIADNLRRGRGRVTLTVLTLVVSIAMITGMTGFITFFYAELLMPKIETSAQMNARLITRFAFENGMSSFSNMSEIGVPPDIVGEVYEALEPYAQIMPWYFVVVPELSFFSDGYFSYVHDPHLLREAGDWTFTFTEGDWESAMPILESGCGVLVAPLVAHNNGVGLGESFTITGIDGPVECTVAGIGAPYVNASIISSAAGGAVGIGDPITLLVWPKPGIDETILDTELAALAERLPINLGRLEEIARVQRSMMVTLPQLLNSLLLLAILAAALGVVNTTMMSVAERRRELGLLRAAGATRRQVRAVVMGEAAVMGATGGVVGLIAGLGFVVIFIVTYGGGAWGAPELDVWAAAIRSAQPALFTGLFGFAAAPFICALAAWLPVRRILRGTVIDTMDAHRKPQPDRQPTRRSPRTLDFLAWRNLSQERTRSILSGLAVTLGVAMVVAADVTGASISEAVPEGEQSFGSQFVGAFLGTGLALVGLVVLAAAAFLVFNAFAMTITQRKRQIGALRALGMTRRQVMRLVLVEALIIGGVGTLAGLVAGVLMGRGLAALMSSIAGFANGEAWPSLPSMILAFVLGLGVTLLSALAPAWQAARISPLVALRSQVVGGDRRVPRRWGYVGVGAGVLLFAYLAFAPPGKWILPPWDFALAGLLVLVWLLALGLILPALVGMVSQLARGPLSRRWGATGRLVADNLGRDRRRVVLTIITLMVGLAMVVALTGFMAFTFKVTFAGVFEQTDFSQHMYFVMPFADINLDVLGTWDPKASHIAPELYADIRRVLGERATVNGINAVILPQIAVVPGFPSYMVDPEPFKESDWFVFYEGNWETAMPVMKGGCGVMFTPRVARANDVWIGDTLTLPGVDGPVECTVAGLGTNASFGTSIISNAAAGAFGVNTSTPFGLVIQVRSGDPVQFDADIRALVADYPDISLLEPNATLDDIYGTMDGLEVMLNGPLLLAILAAALGVINTTMISVSERRRELGLLRAVGATRRQVRAVVAGEAALMGITGGVLGLVAGVGLVVIVVVTTGGAGWGVKDLPLWPSAWQSVQPALLNGLVGLIAAPFICALAAWLPARRILRGTAIEVMEPQRQQLVPLRKAAGRLLGRGSIRARFVLGTGALLLVILAGLVAVVGAHEQAELDEMGRDVMATMLEAQASMIEMMLPDDAQTLDLDALQSGGGFTFDTAMVERFESLMGGLSELGLVDFALADRDNFVLLSLDMDDFGIAAPPLVSMRKSTIESEFVDGEWLMHGTSPIENGAGEVIGSARLTFSLAGAQAFMMQTRVVLWAVGLMVLVIGLAASWALATPLVRAVERLSAQAARVGEGSYTPLAWPGGLGSRFSLRARLTLVMVILVVALVVILNAVVIPAERVYMEAWLKDSLLTAAEWTGQMFSESFTVEIEELLQGNISLEEGLRLLEEFNLATLQALTEQMREYGVVYMALVNRAGEVVLADQFGMIGDSVPVYEAAHVEDAHRHGEAIWTISTPLWSGDMQVGSLQMGMARDMVERFLDESALIFQMAGVAAVLAGVLLAQVIGGAVAAPVQRMAAGTMRVGAGDLDVRFETGTNDELALLAGAFNQMVAGLREREWLHDMFGRFVSREVAEAIRAGQVKLEGENRVVTVLFCDIRGFTALSEQHTPAEIVALLNEYLPVVVEAAQAHDGTVNKFGGDSTLVIYGAPKPLSESAYQAVLTALAMRDGLRRLNAQRAVRGEQPLHIGVGINTGVVLAGAVGPRERQEYTVIGDTVNLASWIEALNKQYPTHDILISHATYEALGVHRSAFGFVDLGEIPIRGKSTPVQVWAVE